MNDQESFSFPDDVRGGSETDHGEGRDLRTPSPRAVARRTDPYTSWEAAESLKPAVLSEIQERVMAFFRLVRRATDEHTIDGLAEYGYADSTLQTRRCELVRRGFLRDSGEYAINRRGRKMIIWELVD